MATGGSNDKDSERGLDLSEIEPVLSEFLQESELDGTKDSLVWEEHKAQELFEVIEARGESSPSGEQDFLGFHTPHVSPISSSDVRCLPSFDRKNLPQSAPTSPLSHHNHATTSSSRTDLSYAAVKDKVRSFENLAKLHAEVSERPKRFDTQINPKPRINTRLAHKKGLSSPLLAPGNFDRKRKATPTLAGVLHLEEIVTMAQTNIASAGRLNPRYRRANGVGDTLASLGFPVLSLDNIPATGKNVLRRFRVIRREIVADVDLIVNEANVIFGKSVIESYLARVVDCRVGFEHVLEDIEEDVDNAEAAIDEILKLEGELQGLLRYCDKQIADRPAGPGGAHGGDPVRLARLEFPEFDGSGNYKAWKTNFEVLAAHVPDELTKKSHLLKILTGNAGSYIRNTMVSESTFGDIMGMLESRYNDPMAVNYSLLNRIFHSPELAKPQSTQAHWDCAVGDIKAIQAGGLTLDEVLVYYRLHKFQPDIVRRVKDMHRLKYPARHSINLEEAVAIMNELTAEEASYATDAVSVEQCVQNLTLTATPKVSNMAKPTQVPPFNNTFAIQSRNNTSRSGRDDVATSGHYSNNAAHVQQTCLVCGGEDHNAGLCPKFSTPAERKKELFNKGLCQYCGLKYSHSHRCSPYIQCRHCRGGHRSWVCTQKVTDGKSDK